MYDNDLLSDNLSVTQPSLWVVSSTTLWTWGLTSKKPTPLFACIYNLASKAEWMGGDAGPTQAHYL